MTDVVQCSDCGDFIPFADSWHYGYDDNGQEIRLCPDCYEDNNPFEEPDQGVPVDDYDPDYQD